MDLRGHCGTTLDERKGSGVDWCSLGVSATLRTRRAPHHPLFSWGQLTFGSSYYAPSFFRDADGHPCLSLWMRGIQDAEAGWSSAHSVPYVLSLLGNRLVATPHPDLGRYQGQALENEHILSGLAFDATWTPNGEASLLKVWSGSDCVLQVSTTVDELKAQVQGETWAMPYS